MFIRPKNIIPLKKNILVIFNKKIKIKLFFKKTIYLFHGGDRYVSIYVNILFPGTMLSQYVFTKKPFSGPIKKGKI